MAGTCKWSTVFRRLEPVALTAESTKIVGDGSVRIDRIPGVSRRSERDARKCQDSAGTPCPSISWGPRDKLSQ